MQAKGRQSNQLSLSAIVLVRKPNHIPADIVLIQKVDVVCRDNQHHVQALLWQVHSDGVEYRPFKAPIEGWN